MYETESPESPISEMNSWPNFKLFRPKLSQNRIKIGEVSKFGLEFISEIARITRIARIADLRNEFLAKF